MPWIWARTCSRSGSNSITGGSWATSVRTWPGWAVTSASPTTAPPLLPKPRAGGGGARPDPDAGPAAAAEDVGRLPAEHRQQAVDVVGLLFGRHILGGVLAGAVADATRVIGHHRVAVGERAGKPGEAGAVHRRADHEQQRAGALPLVVKACTRHVQGLSYRV